MQPIRALFRSTLGRKYIMALTGLAMFLFVIAHLAGNLQIFLGREVINAYGHFLQSNPELLWPARIGLLVVIALHVWSATALTAENRAARPVSYANRPTPVAASYASRTMMMSGLIIACFIVYHLLHFTLQVKQINLTGVDFVGLKDPVTGHHDVFAMMVTGFSNGWVTSFYILGVGLLCLHLSHGAAAMFSSLGFKSRAYETWIRRFAQTAAWLIFLGYISIPLAVFLGFGKQ